VLAVQLGAVDDVVDEADGGISNVALVEVELRAVIKSWVDDSNSELLTVTLVESVEEGLADVLVKSCVDKTVNVVLVTRSVELVKLGEADESDDTASEVLVELLKSGGEGDGMVENSDDEVIDDNREVMLPDCVGRVLETTDDIVALTPVDVGYLN